LIPFHKCIFCGTEGFASLEAVAKHVCTANDCPALVGFIETAGGQASATCWCGRVFRLTDPWSSESAYNYRLLSSHWEAEGGMQAHYLFHLFGLKEKTP
jgi:hypothetical protein